MNVTNDNDSERTTTAPIEQPLVLPEAAIVENSPLSPPSVATAPVFEATANAPTPAAVDTIARSRNYNRNPRRSMRLAIMNRRRSPRFSCVGTTTANDA